ncbi:hypothetical protein N9231_02505 [Saprospiraceae bacterium]|nr:hypothetical protein [Saprospiraceae bacterium]
MKTYLIPCLLIISFIACKQKEIDPIQKMNPTEILDINYDTIIGLRYSDSMVKDMVEKATKSLKINDTLALIKVSMCEHNIRTNDYSFNSDSIAKYEDQLIPVDERLRNILFVTHCFSLLKETEKYKSIIYYYQNYESHYSGEFLLITMNKKTNSIDRLQLAVDYRNELGDEFTSSLIVNDTSIIQSKKNVFRYIHGIGKVDSTSTSSRSFVINEKGEIKLKDK